jgi:hypothetical protein
LALLEASHDHLLVTPSSHFTPQKVEGLACGILDLWRDKNKFYILSWLRTVKENIAYEIAQVNDAYLNICITNVPLLGKMIRTR